MAEIIGTVLKEANFSGTNGTHFKDVLSYEYSQSQENNNTTIKYHCYFVSMHGYSGSGSANTVYSYINGVNVGITDRIGVNETKDMGYKEEIISHNEDGTFPTTNYSSKIDTYWTLGSAKLEGTLTSAQIPNIDRYPMLTSAPDFTDEESPTITYTTNIGFTNPSVQACICSVDEQTIYVPYRDINVSQGSYTFTFTSSEKQALQNATPNNSFFDVKFMIRTSAGGNNYYTRLQRKLQIINANPTVSKTKQELTAKVITLIGSSSASKVVQNASVVRVSVTATPKKGSSISYVRVSNGSYVATKDTAPYTFDVPITEQRLYVAAVDSRVNATRANEDLDIITYTPVHITQKDMERQNPTSSNVILNFKADYEQKSLNGTTNVPVVKWKLDDGNYTTIPSSNYTIDTTNKTLTISNYTLSNVLPYTDPGTFTLYIEDLLTSHSETVDVTKGIPIVELGEDDVQVNGKIYQATTSGTNKKELWEIVYPVGSIYMNVNDVDPQALFGGYWTKLEDTFLLGAGETYTRGDTGGEATHTLVNSEVPHLEGSFRVNQYGANGQEYTSGNFHGTMSAYVYNMSVFSDSTGRDRFTEIYSTYGGGQAHNNMPPYLVVNIWKRTG